MCHWRSQFRQRLVIASRLVEVAKYQLHLLAYCQLTGSLKRLMLLLGSDSQFIYVPAPIGWRDTLIDLDRFKV